MKYKLLKKLRKKASKIHFKITSNNFDTWSIVFIFLPEGSVQTEYINESSSKEKATKFCIEYRRTFILNEIKKIRNE